jgi:hypothetical protein
MLELLDCRASKAFKVFKAAQGLQVSVLQDQLVLKEKQALLVLLVLQARKVIRVELLELLERLVKERLVQQV